MYDYPDPFDRWRFSPYNPEVNDLVDRTYHPPVTRSEPKNCPHCGRALGGDRWQWPVVQDFEEFTENERAEGVNKSKDASNT